MFKKSSSIQDNYKPLEAYDAETVQLNLIKIKSNLKKEKNFEKN